MIELLLQAERSLAVGMLDQAEHIYWQAIERDSQNSIAIVGLARVALERGDERTAYELARRALAIDGENATAQRLVARLEEVRRYRGESTADGETSGPPGPVSAAGPAPTTSSASAAAAGPAPPPAPRFAAAAGPAPPPAPRFAAAAGPARTRGLVDRLLRRR